MIGVVVEVVVVVVVVGGNSVVVVVVVVVGGNSVVVVVVDDADSWRIRLGDAYTKVQPCQKDQKLTCACSTCRSRR